jgi:hypothetical protein
VGDFVRQCATCGGGRDFEVWDGYNGFEVFGFEAHGAYAFGGEGADDEATEQGRGGVVRMTVELADEVEEVRGGHRASEEVVGGYCSSDECRSGTTEAAGWWDVVLLDQVEVDVGFADLVGDEEGRAVGGVFWAVRDQVCSCTVDLDERGGSPVEAYAHGQR